MNLENLLFKLTCIPNPSPCILSIIVNVSRRQRLETLSNVSFDTFTLPNPLLKSAQLPLKAYALFQDF